MLKRYLYTVAFIFLAGFIFLCCTGEKEESDMAGSSDYADVTTLFKEFREFQKPKVTNGVPDYTAAAMEKQYRELKTFQSRLAAINISAWPVSQQVDYHLVRAEMNGLEFYHRVLRPWSCDPCFYLKSQSEAGPVIQGTLRIPRSLSFPEDKLAELRTHLKAIPEIFKQAKLNLTEGARDLATIAIWGVKEESEKHHDLAAWLAEHHPDLEDDAKRAQAAIEDYGKWLNENKHKMTALAGVGKDNYNWWLKNVHLFPYTWQECRDIVQLEDNRVITFLKLEENRNRRLPPLKPVASQEEYRQSVMKSLQHVMRFLREEEIFTVHDYLVTDDYFGSWHEFDKPWPKVHDYFFNFSHRESLPEETHECVGLYFDELRRQRDKRPIRGERLLRLYEINWIRPEGFAFALEELLMHAGYLDKRPRRGREIVYKMAAYRACRALADLKMHSREFILEEAMEFCVKCAPWGDLLAGTHHLRYEMQTSLRFFGHHMGMTVGKVQFMKLFRDRAKQRGDKFNLRQFMDEFLAAGMIPMALTRWEMTGLDDEIRKLW